MDVRAQNNTDVRLAQIRLLVKAARQEIAWLSPTDHELRYAIRCELTDLLKELRAGLPASRAERF
jgi:hypothetical protein